MNEDIIIVVVPRRSQSLDRGSSTLPVLRDGAGRHRVKGNRARARAYYRCRIAGKSLQLG